LRRAAVETGIASVVAWNKRVDATLASGAREQRWIPRERIDELAASRPGADLAKELSRRGVRHLLSSEESHALSRIGRDLEVEVDPVNHETLLREIDGRREFFDHIERSPLTGEQARAVITFDNRVHLIAAAGSGKTSVMIARAAYAVHRGFVSPDRILLLAFNKAAAVELQERIVARFTAAGIPHDGIRAATFHSFGLNVIGKATGHKPRLAPWLDAGQDARMVERIADELRDADPKFRYQWDLFRLLFASAPITADGGTADGYDSLSRPTGFRTLDGGLVRSAGERMIADWLFINGVQFRYEDPYSHRVSDETHSQYRPDFYYPSADVWHEHWALDADGEPPAAFVGYADGIAWKKRIHEQYGTKLIESTWHDVVFGDGLARLERDLTACGIPLDWNPDRPLPEFARPLQHADLARLMRTFMAHVKSNSLDQGAVDARARTGRKQLIEFRTQLFLDLYWPIHREWDRRLRGEESVDFEDMLVLAADHLERGEVDMGYDLVLVDEFQDASQARARLVRGLLQRPGRYLLAVGDDWQAINRFAGADISVMKKFAEWFGTGPQLALTTTFRCPQSICEVASTFVTRNPGQFRKSVRSAQADPGPPITLIRANDVRSGVGRYLRQLSDSVSNGTVRPNADGRVTVDILGRYGFDRDSIPPTVPDNLVVTFRTAHGSKGLEADYIVLPRVVSGRYGFPSEIADDPVLELAMAEPDRYPNAEERRLFYVALTRARRQATLVTQVGQESAFIVELLRDGLVVPVDDQGTPLEQVRVCRLCGEGTMVRRKGRFGEFLGCSRFPACKGTVNLTDEGELRRTQ
jgi:DNA helicase-4